MIYELTLAIHYIEGMPGVRKGVLLALASCCRNKDATDIYPTLDLLARKSCFCERTVRRTLALLEQEGYITSSGRKNHIKVFAIVCEKIAYNPEKTKGPRPVAQAPRYVPQGVTEELPTPPPSAERPASQPAAYSNGQAQQPEILEGQQPSQMLVEYTEDRREWARMTYSAFRHMYRLQHPQATFAQVNNLWQNAREREGTLSR